MTGANWWVDAFPASVPGSAVYGGGGGGADMLTARDPLDARRMAAGFAPGASYPDGYLGNYTDRNADKLAVAQGRDDQSQQRGVHVGDRVSPASYFWDSDMDPSMGLARQEASVPDLVEGGLVFLAPRAAPTGDPVEMLAHDGKTAMLSPREQEDALRAAGGNPAMNPVQVVDPSRRARLAGDLPPWSGVFRA